MKKILNQVADFVPEMLQGLLLAHPDMLAHAGDDVHCIVRAHAPVAGKVALATGGGSGHLPVFLGYVGKGMLDGCAVGDVFASPSADQMYEVTKRISGGSGPRRCPIRCWCSTSTLKFPTNTRLPSARMLSRPRENSPDSM